MKVALLVCDHVLEKLEHIGGQYPKMFAALLPSIDLVPYWVCDGQFPSIDDYDAFICSGSKYSVYNKIPWILKLQQFMVDAFQADKKLFGSCFGHQMIAQALGGKVEKAKTGWSIGVQEFETQSNKEWMSPQADNFKSLLICRDQVVQLPENSTVHATSNHCPVGMFSVANKFLGIQPHPEFSKEYHQALYTGRSEQIGNAIIENANSTMHLPLDTKIIVDWIMHFLSRKA